MIGVPDPTSALQAQLAALGRACAEIGEARDLLLADPGEWHGLAREAFDGARGRVRDAVASAGAHLDDAQGHTRRALDTVLAAASAGTAGARVG